MDIRIDQRATATNPASGMARLQWLVRKLSRRDGAALALPLSLAVLGGAIARERDAELQQDGAGTAEQDASEAQSGVLQPGDRLALMAGDAVLLEHLLTDADLAAGQVRVALRMIDSARLPGVRTIEAAEAGSAAVQDLDAATDAAEAQMQAGAATPGEGDGEAGAFAESSGAQAATAGTADAGAGAFAGQEDDDDLGVLWLALGVGAVGAGLALIHDDKEEPLHTITGQVVKGYVQGAAVYLDIDGDGQPDGDPVYTDAEGRFTLTTDQAGASVVVYGGVDTLTNVPFEGMLLRAPAGSTVVTPLTTLLDEMMRQDDSLDAAAAQARLLSAFGLTLPAGTDLRTYDPVAGVANGGEAAEDQSEVVLNTIASIQSILTGAGAAGDLAAANAAVIAIARAARESESLDLTSSGDLQAVLEGALANTGVGASNADDLAALAGAIASVNGTLAEASGLGEEALQATRYAFSGFQDLLTRVGAASRGSEQYERDLSLSADSELADAIDAINGGGLGEVIGAGSGLSISFAERHEGGRYVLALNPELKFHEGKPDTIDQITVRFDVEGVVVQMETRGTNGEVTVTTLTPDGEGRYQIAYADLDKVFFQAPENFNGVLGAEASVHYVGLDVTDTPPKVGIRIDAVNDAPDSADASVSAIEDEPYVFTLADFPFTDAVDAAYEGGANSLAAIRIVSLPVNGALLLGEETIEAADLLGGLFVSAADIAGGRLRYVSAADGHGAAHASFQFQVKDDGGTARGGVDLSENVYTLTVNVAPASDAPVATGGEVSLAEDSEYTFSAADFGFTDVDGDELLGVLIVSLPDTGTLYFDDRRLRGEDVEGEGLPIRATDLGRLTYVPGEDYNGGASFDYRVADAGADGANLSNVATMDLTVTAVSDAPAAGDNGSQVDEDVQHAFDAADFGFTDIDGDSLAAVLITGLPAHGELRFDGIALGSEDVADGGFVVAVADLGRLTYLSDQDYNGSDSFAYRLRDSGSLTDGGANTSAEAHFALDVQPVTDAPVASENSFSLSEDGSLTFNSSSFAFSDADGDELVAVRITSLPQNGRLVYHGATLYGEDLGEDGFAIAIEDLGKLQFVAGEDYNGPVSFGYRLQDSGAEGSNLSDEAMMEGVVYAVSDAPVATGSTVNFDEDSEHVFTASDFGFSDVDGDSMTGVYITSLPATGSLYWNGEMLTAPELGEDGLYIAANELANLSYVPPVDYNGAASFQYRVQDSGEAGSNVSGSSGTLTFDIQPMPDFPTATVTSVTMDEDGSYTFSGEDFPFTDVDGDSLDSVHIMKLPTDGVLSFKGVALTDQDMNDGFFRIPAADLGELVFTPAADFSGEAGFFYRVQDSGPYAAYGHETFYTINVQPRPDAPTASPDVLAVNEDEPHTFSAADFGFADVDGDALAGVYITSLPKDGTLRYDGEDLNSGLLGEDGLFIAAADLGKLVFSPYAEFSGNASFGFRVKDDGEEGSNLGAAATLQIKVDAVNDAPVFSVQQTSDCATPEPGSTPAFRVNTTLEGSQEAPRIAALTDGGYVVVWTTRTATDPVDYEIHGQRFSAAGDKLGEEFRISDTSIGYQSEPTVLAGPRGGFGVAWTNRVDGNADIHVRDFDADGEPVLDSKTLNTYTASNQMDPAVAVLDQGTVVVWTSNLEDGSGYGVYARVASPSGIVEFRVNTTTSFDQFQPAVAALADGSFVVTWTGVNEFHAQQLYSRRFSADGTPIDATEVAVHQPSHSDQYQSVVTALSDGGYVVAWTSATDDDVNITDIYLQRFGADGQPAGDPVLVNEGLTEGEQREPAIIGLPTGGFMVAWTSWGSEDSSLDVYAQRFGTDGLPLGDRVLVNSLTTDKEQTTPAIAVLADGSVVITWQSNTDQGGDNFEVYAQHFNAMTPWFIEGASGNREDVVPVLIAPTATVSDIELEALNDGDGDWSGARLVLQREQGEDSHSHHRHHGRGGSPDHFEFQAGQGYTLDEQGLLLKDGLPLGRLVQAKGRLVVEFGTFGEIDLSGYEGIATPTTADVNHVLQHLAYWNSSDGPGDSVVLQYRMEDGNEGTQGLGGEQEGGASVEVRILDINDAPQARRNGELLLEDHSHTFDASDFRFRDAEGDELRSVTITSLPGDGKLLYDGRELTQEDLECEDGGFTIEACDLSKLQFVPADNFHGRVEFNYYLRDDGGTERGGQDTSEEATFRINVMSVNDAPELDLRGYTFVVTALDDNCDPDDGKLSLREALALAGDGDSITFATSLSGGTIELDSTLAIASNVYINGQTGEGCEGITLRTNGGYTAIDVTACVTEGSGVVLSNLSIRGDDGLIHTIDESDGPAAALVNGGTLTLHQVEVSGYHQQSADGTVVSVLWNKDGAVLRASELELEDNAAFGLAGQTATLILNEGSMDLTDPSFEHNHVTASSEGGDAWLVLSDTGSSLGVHEPWYIDNELNATHENGRQGDILYAVEDCEVDVPDTEFRYEAPDLRARYTEDSDCGVRLMPHARVTDVELDARSDGAGNWAGASIMIAPRDEGDCEWGWFTSDPDSELGLAEGHCLSFSDGIIYKDAGEEPVAIGNYEIDEGGALLISFPKSTEVDAVIPTSADVNNILRLVTYRNTSQDPADTVTFGISVSDGNGRFFGRQGFGGEGRELGEVTVVINAVNDAPEFDLEAHPPVVISREEDETYVFGNSDFPFTDVEGDCLGGVVITSLPVDGFLAVDGRIVTATQVDCDGFFVSAEDIACGRFTFTPAPDYHGVASFEYRVRDDGGTDNGGVDTTADTATFTFDVRSVNDAPELALSPTADYTFVVTTLEDSSDPDDGKLSLREALALACDGDSITFDPALLSGGEGRIVLESTLAIDKQVYINGAVAGGRIHLVRDECLDGPMVAVSCDVGSGSGGAVLQGLVLDGDCVESSAPALVNAGHLVMHEVTITDQQAVNDSGDVVSALLNEYGGVLVATSLTVSGNSAQAGAGGDAHAILNRGRLTVDELSVSGNTQSGGDSVDGQGGDAFALYNDGTYYQGAVDFCDNNSVAGSGDDCGCDAGGPGRSGDSGGCEAEATGFALMFVAPALTGTRPDAALTYVVGSDAVRLAPDAVLSDVELGSLRQGEGNWSGARIEIRRAEGADGDDVFGSDLCHDTLAINESGEITKLVEGTERVIGSYTATGGVLAIHFTGHGTAYPTTEDVNAILRSLTYSHASEEFEGTVDLVVTVRDGNAAFDGPQGAGSEGAPGEGIVTGTIQVNVELVPLSTPLSVMLVNDAECVSDGITGSPEGAVLLFDVTFADEELVEGQQVRLYRDGELFGSQVVGAEHLINGIVTVSVSTTGLEDFDFSKVVARVAADENSSRESGDSPAFFLTYDTVAPEPPLFYVNSQKAVFTGGEVEGEGEGEAAGGALLFTGTAEAFSTVRLSAQTFAEGGELGEFVTQADADGRFSLHMAFPGMYIHDGGYNIRVVVEDRAGNVSIAIPLDEYISSSTTTWIDDEADITTGHVYTDSGVVGFRVSDSMHAGRVGTEWMIAPSAQYASVFLEGVPEDYTFTLLEGDVRADAISLASSEVVTAIGEGPLYLMEYWGSSSETRTRLYLQVDAVHFSDGASIGLSADGVHVLNLTTPDEGHSAIQGGAGNERLVGSSSVDALFGGDGDNVLIGGGGDDVLVSYGAADQAGDVLMGGEGNDILIAMGDSSATGPVSMYGGAGSDIFAIAPVEADDLWFNQALSPRFNRDVTIHDFVIGEDRIDLSWVYAAGEGDTYRRITGEDLDIQSLAEDLQDDGVMTIDLTQFFTADGTALEGTLNVQLAGGSTVLTGDSFMLGDESMMDYLRGQEYLWDALRIIEPL